MRRAQMIFRSAMNENYYLPAEKLLEMTTIDAARCVGLDKEIGSQEVGKKADVIAVNLMNPRLMPRFNVLDTMIGNANPTDVDLVLVDGEIKLDKNGAVSVDEREVLLKAEEEARETVARTPYLDAFAHPKKKQWGQTKMYFDEVRFDLEENRKDGGHY